jgi:hypothetical protein
VEEQGTWCMVFIEEEGEGEVIKMNKKERYCW